MCFFLYAATTKPLPRQAWELGSPNLAVKSLTPHDDAIKANFSNPEVQLIGSTSGCGCDFPRAFLQGETWTYYSEEQIDPEEALNHQTNREALYNLLRSTGDSIVELYGVWDEEFSELPRAHESISAERILNPDFRLKERGFYRVRLTVRA